MAYFPESLMPARFKQESADVDGNRHVVSATDFNRYDEEIRAIEKTIGLRRDAPDNCSIAGVLEGIEAHLQRIREDMVLTNSGVVAVADADVVGVDGKIPIPSSWPVTTLVSAIADASVATEEELPVLTSITLDDVTDMPDEGFISIINDVEVSTTQIVHGNELIIISPRAATGKVGEEFFYEIVSANIADLSYAATALPAGLILQGNTIIGTPTAAGTTVVTISVSFVTTSSGTRSTAQTLTITIVAADNPTITNATLTASVTKGSTFSYEITFTGTPATITASPLPAGLTIYGPFISGTPREAAVVNILMTVTDEFGDSDSATLVLTIT